MGRNDTFFPWKCFRVLQFAIFSVCINATVENTQFFTAISPYYVKESIGGSFESTGVFSGLLVGSYFLGRALTHRCWIRAILDFGFRPVFLFALVIETAATFAICVISQVYLALITRFIAGCFSPIAPLTSLLVRRLNEEFGEDFPLVAGTLSFVSTLGMIIGYLISGCVAFPAENKIVDGSVFRKYPFLFAWVLDGCILFLCLFCLCLELPDLLAEKEKVKKASKPPTGGRLGAGKYAELAEQGVAQTDGQQVDSTCGPISTTNQENPVTNQENPMTERKEAGDAEDEDIPAYLQCFELEEVHSAEVAAGVCGPVSHRSAMIPSPMLSPRTREAEKPMTERVCAEEKSQMQEIKIAPVDGPRPSRSEKTTFISFVEEDFQKALNSTKVSTLDDPYKRPPGEHPVPYRWSVTIACLSNFIGCWLEATFVVWAIIRSRDDISVAMMGVMLAWSVAGAWFSMFMLSNLCTRTPLHQAFAGHCFLLVFVLAIAVLVPHVELRGVAWVLVLLCLVFAFRYCTVFMNTFAMLLVGDSGFLRFRPVIVLTAETWISLAKAFGYSLGPLLFSVGEHFSLSYLELPYLAAGGLSLLAFGLNYMSMKHFPRFREFPYAM